MSGKVVRPATAADLDALLALVEQYWRFEDIKGFAVSRLAPVLRRLLDDGKLGRAWLALVDGEPAGYLAVVFVFSIEYGGLTAEIDEFFVVPEHRGQALGGELFAVAESACLTTGCVRMVLQLGRQNDAARRFYRRNGLAERADYELLDKNLI